MWLLSIAVNPLIANLAMERTQRESYQKASQSNTECGESHLLLSIKLNTFMIHIKIKTLKYFFLIVLCAAFVNTITAQSNAKPGTHSKIYIVRHAEKLGGDDPLLTDEGNKRVGDLMRVLKNKKISRIYVTEFKRTQNTGDSLRIQLGIDTVQINADTSCASLFAAITQHKDWNKSILIITHSNIIQKVIYKLGITDFSQENIPAAEFDNLYTVSIKKNKPVLQHIKYGKASGSSATMKH